jgi:LemA protein
MKKLTLAIVILALVIGGGFLMFYLYGTRIYDGAVSRQETVDQAWGNVQAAYQRRADLIPNLVATVQGAAENEKEILTEVTKARAGIQDAKTPAELEQFGGTINRAINVVFERYPEVRATQNFGVLQAQLEGTENRINTERTRYNEAVKDFNGYIRGFWRSKALGLVSNADDNFTRRDMFEAKEGAQDAPQVDFSDKSE